MLPHTLALTDDNTEYAEFLALHLQAQGIQVSVFHDSHDLLAQPDFFGFDFYIVDLMLPGIDGVDLIKVLRRRSNAGILVVSGRTTPDAFKQVIDAGADMFLSKPVEFEQVALAIRAVQRRSGPTPQATMAWALHQRARQLVAPDGARVDLSAADMVVMTCFVEAAGEPVTRDTLRERLGHTADGEGADGLNATIYRLRRRIERATPIVVPLQSKSRVGYVFRAPLTLV